MLILLWTINTGRDALVMCLLSLAHGCVGPTLLGGKNLQKHVVVVIPTTLVMIAVKDETGFRLRLWMRFLLIASDSRQLSFPASMRGNAKLPTVGC